MQQGKFRFKTIKKDFVSEYEGLEKKYGVYSASSGSLAAFAGIKGGERVVDLGCGTGISSRQAGRIVGREGSVTGIDISAEMLGRAKKNLEKNRNVRFVLGDAFKLSGLVSKKADVIISNFTFFYFRSNVGALAGQVCGALKKGGRYVFNIPPFMVPSHFGGREYNKFTHIVFEETDKVMKENGFRGRGSCAVDISLVGDCKKVRSILKRAGFSSVKCRVAYLPLTAGQWLDFIITFLKRGDTTYFSSELMRVPLQKRMRLIRAVFKRSKKRFRDERMDENPAVFEVCAVK